MIALFLLIFSISFSQYYELEITDTGQSHLVVIQETINLEPGTEIGIFDQQAILNDGNCETEYGELLVATGVWDGTQLNLTAIGSIDFCDVGGEQRAGYIEDNEIIIRVYNPNELTEYTTSFLTFDGLEPSFISGFVTAISEITIEDVYYYDSINEQILLNDFKINRIFPNPANPFININYELSRNENFSISIFSISGDLFQNIQNPPSNIGNNTIHLNLSDYPSGSYFFQLKSKKQSKMQKFVVLK